MCATHGVRLLHTLCIPPSFSSGVIGKNNREKQAPTGLMTQLLRKLLRKVDENKGALSGNQHIWEMLWYLPVLLHRCKEIN